MASNSFGSIFRITTFGESRAEMMGVVLDGVPAGIAISLDEVQQDLNQRRPGRPNTSQRQEKDLCRIVSGLYEGKTTGAPLCILIANEETQTYEDVDLLKPGSAAFAYFQKYGNFDPRGGGRASGRETALRVAAGAIAKKILSPFGVRILAYVSEVGEIQMAEKKISFEELKNRAAVSPFSCPDPDAEKKMEELFEEMARQQESIGGVVSFLVENVPPNLGDPVYEKLSANIARAMMGIPGARGFEIGEGFRSCRMKGSEHNDLIGFADGEWFLKSNHSGGVLGGISTKEPLFGRVAFKPTPSIALAQKTVNTRGEEKEINSLAKRNDPCIAIRACPVVEAMLAIVLVDSLMMHSALQISEGSSIFNPKQLQKLEF